MLYDSIIPCDSFAHGPASGGIAWHYAACGYPPDESALRYVWVSPPTRANMKRRRYPLLLAGYEHRFTDTLDISLLLLFARFGLSSIPICCSSHLSIKYTYIIYSPGTCGYRFSLLALSLSTCTIYSEPRARFTPLGLIIDHSVSPIRVRHCDPHTTLPQQPLHRPRPAIRGKREDEADMSQLSKSDIYHT